MYMNVDILYRMSYMKANVHQVYRYLTAYLNAGGSFPEKENSRIRNLASEVSIFYYSSYSILNGVCPIHNGILETFIWSVM